jgi:hypothetical protein
MISSSVFPSLTSPITQKHNYENIFLASYDSFLCNEYGSLRWRFIRRHYFSKNLTIKDIIDIYPEWRDDSEFFILHGLVDNSTMQSRLISKYDPPEDTWFLEPEKEDIYKFIKASKRGNDVYKHLVSEKLKPLMESQNIMFFDDHTTDKRTSVLFITLTYDNKKCGIDQAWKNIGVEFHLFHNNLRKMYGAVEVFRTWESTQNCYPHIHSIFLFEEHSFPVILHEDKNGVVSYRIPYNEKEKIGKHWHSNIDIQALQDTQGGVKELTKYITKDLCSKKGDITNAMLCLHNKRSYAISKGFVKAITGWYINCNEPTNYDLINQMCNCNSDVVKWEFLGILRGRDLGFSDNIWCVDYKKPPPRVIELVLKERKRWLILHGNR